jgi:Protein of unknown function (DUF2568)
VSAHGPQDVGILQAAVFLDELVLLAALAVAGARLVDGALGRIALAVAFPLVAAVIWGRWLAPRARGRLAHPGRLVVKLALIAAASALLIAADLAPFGVVFFLVSAALFTAGEFSER